MPASGGLEASATPAFDPRLAAETEAAVAARSAISVTRDGVGRPSLFVALPSPGSNSTEAERTWRLEYDNSDRVRAILAPTDSAGGAHQTTFDYDTVGNIIAVHRADGQIDRYRYDERNSVAEADWASGVIARYAYDDRGDLVHATQLASDGSVVGEVAYTFDGLHRPRSMTLLPAGTRIMYAYSEVGGCQAFQFTS
jgi:YD repeat-containing protein